MAADVNNEWISTFKISKYILLFVFSQSYLVNCELLNKNKDFLKSMLALAIHLGLITVFISLIYVHLINDKNLSHYVK